jgi:uncharacterized membrane protein
LDFLARLHPIVIHFPIAFLILYMFVEILNVFVKKSYLQKSSLLMLFLGVIGGIASVLTGNQAFQKLPNNSQITQIHYMAVDKHELFASITVWYFLVLLIFKYYRFIKKKNESRIEYLFVIFVIVGAILLYKTAKFGGILVYNFGIGTDLIK